jgi:hypothetical protein
MIAVRQLPRRLLVLLVAFTMALSALFVITAPPAQAAVKSCGSGQVRIYSYRSGGTYRTHFWTNDYVVYHYHWDGGNAGWLYTYTGNTWADYFYYSDGTINPFSASCVPF